LSIVNVTDGAAKEIKKMLADEDLSSANLRIAGRIDMDGDKMGEGYQLFLSELTLNDQYQEFDDFNIIVANILLRINGGFNIDCMEEDGKTRLQVLPFQNKPSGIYRGAGLGTAARL